MGQQRLQGFEEICQVPGFTLCYNRHIKCVLFQIQEQPLVVRGMLHGHAEASQAVQMPPRPHLDEAGQTARKLQEVLKHKIKIHCM